MSNITLFVFIYFTGRSNSRISSGLNRGFGGSDPRLLEHNTPSSSRGASPARSHDSPLASQSDVRQVPRTSRLQAPQVSRIQFVITHGRLVHIYSNRFFFFLFF